MAAKLIWKQEYSVGLEQIDEHHRHFFDLINAIEAQAKRKTVSKDHLQKLLTHLRDYAFYHFATEEEYLERYGYRGRKIHARLHDAFRLRIEKFLDRTEDPRTDAASLYTESADYAKKWLLHHILVEDKQCEKVFAQANELPLPSHLEAKKSRRTTTKRKRRDP